MSKVALVTGGGKGIGRAIALQLAKDGMDVAVIDINKENMDAVVKEVEALGQKSTGFIADVSDRDQVYAAVAHTEKEQFLIIYRLVRIYMNFH